jgi:hypothetical protein
MGRSYACDRSSLIALDQAPEHRQRDAERFRERSHLDRLGEVAVGGH